MLTSASRINAKADAVELLKEAASLGPVAAVFCVALEKGCPKVDHLHLASSEVAPQLEQFVCLLGGSESVCESRAHLGLPVCLIQSEDVLSQPKQVLPYLSSLLADNKAANHTYSYLASHPTSASNRDNKKLTALDPLTFLPSSVTSLMELNQSVTEQPILLEVVTRAPPYEIVKYNILPVFILPGIDSSHLQPFISQLMHPAYCASLPLNSHSVEKTADALLQEVIRIQPHGPYNLVAESWSGATALQLGTQLESLGHKVELFLLDAAPQNTQQCAKVLCEKCSSFEAALLGSLLNLKAETRQSLTNLKSWEEQIQRAVNELVSRSHECDRSFERSTRESLVVALTALRNHLCSVFAYKPRDIVFKGNVHLIRPSYASELDFCGLELYCQEKPNLCITEDKNHKEMLENSNCSSIVNENLAFSWDM